MSGTDLTHGSLSAYAMSGTEIQCDVRYKHNVCCNVLRLRYAMSGTEIAYAATRRVLSERIC
eukprot:1621897-Rhodomonas_salina.8